MYIRCITAVLLMTFLCAAPLPARAADVPAILTVAKYSGDDNAYSPPRHEIARELKIKENYQFYDIQGDTLAELRNQMRQLGTKWNDGKVYAALTTWDIRYDYDITNVNDRFGLKSVTTNIDIVFHLPRRLHTVTAPDELANQWNKYMEHLRVHEIGHKDLAVKAAAEINHILASLGTFSSKSELSKAADRLVKAELKRMKQVQIAYDDDTRHGETQGAILADNH